MEQLRTKSHQPSPAHGRRRASLEHVPGHYTTDRTSNKSPKRQSPRSQKQRLPPLKHHSYGTPKDQQHRQQHQHHQHRKKKPSPSPRIPEVGEPVAGANKNRSPRRLSMPTRTDLESVRTHATQHSLDCPGFPKASHSRGGGTAAASGRADEITVGSLSSSPFGSADSFCESPRRTRAKSLYESSRSAVVNANVEDRSKDIDTSSSTRSDTRTSSAATAATGATRWSSASAEVRRKLRENMSPVKKRRPSVNNRTLSGLPLEQTRQQLNRDIVVRPDEINQASPSPTRQARRARRRNSCNVDTGVDGTAAPQQPSKSRKKGPSRRRSMSNAGKSSVASESHRGAADRSIFTSKVATATEYEFDDTDAGCAFGPGRLANASGTTSSSRSKSSISDSKSVQGSGWSDPFSADPFDDADVDISFNPSVPSRPASVKRQGKAAAAAATTLDTRTKGKCRGSSGGSRSRSHSLQPNRKRRPSIQQGQSVKHAMDDLSLVSEATAEIPFVPVLNLTETKVLKSFAKKDDGASQLQSPRRMVSSKEQHKVYPSTPSTRSTRSVSSHSSHRTPGSVRSSGSSSSQHRNGSLHKIHNPPTTPGSHHTGDTEPSTDASLTHWVKDALSPRTHPRPKRCNVSDERSSPRRASLDVAGLEGNAPGAGFNFQRMTRRSSADGAMSVVSSISRIQQRRSSSDGVGVGAMQW